VGKTPPTKDLDRSLLQVYERGRDNPIKPGEQRTKRDLAKVNSTASALNHEESSSGTDGEEGEKEKRGRQNKKLKAVRLKTGGGVYLPEGTSGTPKHDGHKGKP